MVGDGGPARRRPPVLILVRHGQSEANAAGLLVGRTDSTLTELGRRQAACMGSALAASLSGGEVRLLASPLARTRETAEIVGRSLPEEPAIELEERLLELDYGDLDGLRPSAVEAGMWAAWRDDPSFRPPGGESFVELHRRLDPLWAELAGAAAAGDVIAVTHVSPIKAAVAWVLGAGPELAWRLSLGVAAITRVSFGGGDGARPTLASFGETGHLAGLRAV